MGGNGMSRSLKKACVCNHDQIPVAEIPRLQMAGSANPTARSVARCSL